MEKRSVSQSIAESQRGASEFLESGPRLRHQFMTDYNGSPGEVNNEPSKTTPDQSLTIQQLLLNHTRGISSEVYESEGEFFDDLEIPQIHDLMDLYERREILNEQINELETLKNENDEVKENTGSSTFATADDLGDSEERGKNQGNSSE